MKISEQTEDSKEIWFWRGLAVAALICTVLAAWGSWVFADWLIVNEYIPGTNNPDDFGYLICRLVATFCICLCIQAILLVSTLIFQGTPDDL